MNESRFNVAGFTFCVKDPCNILPGIPGNYRPFLLTDEQAGSVPIFTLEMVEGFTPRDDREELYVDQAEDDDMPLLNLYSHSEGYMVEMAPLKSVPVCGWLDMSKDFTRGKLYVSKDPRFALDNSLMLLFAFSTACKGALEMHSSVVMHGGRGYMFLGKSGTGKSTHSSLWLKNIPDTELLNDDNPIIRCMPDGSVHVFGSPWSGKTPCYKSKDVPIGAIVRIRQAPFNEIHRLGITQAYSSIFSSASGFRPIKGMADGLHESIATVVSKVPCFTLDCLPDNDAALVCHKSVTLKDDE